MPVQYDTEFAEALALIKSGRPPAPPETALEMRHNNHALFLKVFPKPPSPDIVEQTDYTVESYDGVQILLRRYATPKVLRAKEPQPATLVVHGGGFVSGTVEICGGTNAAMALEIERPVFAVDYRLAPEHPCPAAVEDSFASLKYLIDHAKELNIDPFRICVKGNSAGGGIAVGTVLMARDRELNPPVAKLMAIYPELDDRTCHPPDTEFLKLASWTSHHNQLAWKAYVGEDKAGKLDADISPYAAPARAQNYKGLPSTYVDVGTLDLFRDEDLEFVRRLLEDDVEVEFHLWPGVPHVFEFLAPGTRWHQRAKEAQNDALRRV
ncbi:lipase esterase [Fusarium denticulatum]|uniref:Lipase esterase n=1 Tax=Fusarium denticulatum TaxID=48507 RepID=A0A8H5T9G4_9HYPO|nr:lipase esterase [Fusarium denticulatum]